MKYIDTSKPVDVPDEIAVCPECGEPLEVEVDEYTEEGEITEGGFNISCTFESQDFDWHSQRRATDWMPAEAKVYQWLLNNVRVADATEVDLKSWNESARDWAIT